jgi:hypothetical protein
MNLYRIQRKTVTKREFYDYLTDIFEFYGKKHTLEGKAKRYWDILNLYTIEELIGAFNKHLAHPVNGQFLPYPSHITMYLHSYNYDYKIVSHHDVKSFEQEIKRLLECGWETKGHRFTSFDENGRMLLNREMQLNVFRFI